MEIFIEEAMRDVANNLTNKTITDDALTNWVNVEWKTGDDVIALEEKFANLVYRWGKLEAELWKLYKESNEFNRIVNDTGADDESA